MAWFPGAKKHLLAWAHASPSFDQKNKFILHTSVGGMQGALGAWAKSRLYSSFYVELDGTLTQFCDSNAEAPANWSANDSAISIEGADHGNPTWQWDPYSTAQVDSILKLIRWAAQTHPKIKYVRCPTDTSAGLGFHSLHGSWNRSHHACPGPARIAQFTHVILPLLQGLPLKSGVTKDMGGFRGTMVGDEVEHYRKLVGDGIWLSDIVRSVGSLNPTKPRAGVVRSKKATGKTTPRRLSTTRRTTHRTALKTHGRATKRATRA